MSLKLKEIIGRRGLPIIILTLAIIAFTWGKSKYDDWNALPSKLRAYEDARLGETKDEALMILGPPQLVQGLSVNEQTGNQSPSKSLRVEKWQDDRFMKELLKNYNVIPEGTEIRSYNTWQYIMHPRTGKTYSLTFDNSVNISKIECNSDSTSCDKIFGIEIYTSEEQVRYLLGEPDQQILSEHGAIKKMVYRTLGLTLSLERERVVSIAKIAPREVDFIWWLRHGMLK